MTRTSGAKNKRKPKEWLLAELKKYEDEERAENEKSTLEINTGSASVGACANQSNNDEGGEMVRKEIEQYSGSTSEFVIRRPERQKPELNETPSEDQNSCGACNAEFDGEPTICPRCGSGLEWS